MPPGLLPTVFVLGPLALPVLLLIAALGVLSLFLRRWWVLLAVSGAACATFWAQAWLSGKLSDSWWRTLQARWVVITCLAVAGTAWSWRRHRAEGGLGSCLTGVLPGRLTRLVFLAGGILCLAGALAELQASAPRAGSRGLLATGLVLLAGALYPVTVDLIGRRPALKYPAAETVMLGVLAVTGLILVATASVPARTESTPVLWMFEPPERGAVVSSPLVHGDRVYVAAVRDSPEGSAGAVYALARDSGRVLWSFDDGGGMLPPYATPCVFAGRLYVGEGMHGHLNSKLYCLDVATGRKQWAFPTAGHIESSPCAGDGRVFFGAGDDGLYCLDAATGAPHWRFEDGLHIDASPLLADGWIYAGSGVTRQRPRPEAFCLDARTGQPRWRVRTDLPAWGSPTLGDGRVYFGLGSGRLVEDRGGREPPAGGILCLEAATGKAVWRRDLGDAVLARPSLDAGRLFVGTRAGDAWCLDALDGRTVWRTPVGSPIVNRPVCAGDGLIVAAQDGRVWRLERDTGKAVWSFDLARYTGARPRILSSPAVIPASETDAGHGRIFIGAELRNPVTSAAAVVCLRD